MLAMSGDHRAAVFDAFMQLALSDFTIAQCGEGSFLCEPAPAADADGAVPFANPRCVVEAGEVAAHVRALTDDGASEEEKHEEVEAEEEESSEGQGNDESEDEDEGRVFVFGQTVNKRCRITQVFIAPPPGLDSKQ